MRKGDIESPDELTERGEVVRVGKALGQYSREEMQKTWTQRGGKIAEKVNGGLGKTRTVNGLPEAAEDGHGLFFSKAKPRSGGKQERPEWLWGDPGINFNRRTT
ncbi:hypothetical protein DESUT3_41080 [Desulfuromonas versatilis]|uniref:Uncharacterized protein n=1 Tax=Desulfuromonas versatilis TaxID=2802975 RepID=A0ABN6E7H2_9BACT|nr:hypothetical protein [Desulfuromonas versatilis]BCR07039.1 hypothetical protein DESUT3_41080 [Desulfuromonas versatilis]